MFIPGLAILGALRSLLWLVAFCEKRLVLAEDNNSVAFDLRMADLTLQAQTGCCCRNDESDVSWLTFLKVREMVHVF